ncbi:hypothetical protein MVEG_04628 [Podila verticillata NRRL 6337]|nr:hypothetical protein MVEG_04628 [Podila verticillata NRRL 6337]
MALDSSTLAIAFGVGIPIALLCVLFDYLSAKAKAKKTEQRVDEEIGRQVDRRIEDCASSRVVTVPAPVECSHCLHCHPTSTTPYSSSSSYPAMSEVDYTLPSYSESQGPLLHPGTNISNNTNSLQTPSDPSTSRNPGHFQGSYPMLHPGLTPAPPVSRPLSTPSISPAPQL